MDLKTRFTGLNSDYQQALASYTDEQSNISYWEQLLQPAELTLQASQTQAETKAGYDITSAYKSYLQQQRTINDSALLGTSKNALTSQAREGYESLYNQAQSALSTSLASAYEQYSKDYQSAYKTLGETATQVKNLQSKLFDYLETNYAKYGVTEKELYDMYKMNPNSQQFEQTELGSAIIQKMLESTELLDEKNDIRGNAFLTELKQSDPNLYNFFMENRDMMTTLLADYTSKDYSANHLKEVVDKNNLEKAQSENPNILALESEVKDHKKLVFNNNSYKIMKDSKGNYLGGLNITNLDEKGLLGKNVNYNSKELEKLKEGTLIKTTTKDNKEVILRIGKYGKQTLVTVFEQE